MADAMVTAIRFASEKAARAEAAQEWGEFDRNVAVIRKGVELGFTCRGGLWRVRGIAADGSAMEINEAIESWLRAARRGNL